MEAGSHNGALSEISHTSLEESRQEDSFLDPLMPRPDFQGGHYFPQVGARTAFA
jgi:hypothetical protein